MKKKNFLIILLFCIIVTSCSVKSNNTDINDNSTAFVSQTNDNMFSYIIPDGYNHRESHNEDLTVYLTKNDDFDGKEGYISISSLEKIDLPLDDLINRYCLYFDDINDIVSFTYKTFMNENNIQCLQFSLIFDDYYDDICYVLMDEADICIEVMYYSINSDIINGFNEVIDSINY